MKYRHQEAFCLMTYQDEVTGERETIWNSRDGVTPFMVSSGAGNTSQHVDWHRDRRAPDHTPQLGDRVFVDLTLERATAYRTDFVERYWDQEMAGCRLPDQFSSKEEAVRELAKADMEQGGGGAPDLITVDQAFLDELAQARSLKVVLDKPSASVSIDDLWRATRRMEREPTSLLRTSLLREPSAPPMSTAQALLELASFSFDELRAQVTGTPLEGFLRKVRAIVKGKQPEAAVVGLDMLLGGGE